MQLLEENKLEYVDLPDYATALLKLPDGSVQKVKLQSQIFDYPVPGYITRITVSNYDTNEELFYVFNYAEGGTQFQPDNYEDSTFYKEVQEEENPLGADDIKLEVSEDPNGINGGRKKSYKRPKKNGGTILINDVDKNPQGGRKKRRTLKKRHRRRKTSKLH